ncbi:MAG: M48 family metallopeptidase, partial [Clostridia bacterium]|nr:M48 family metallopeptidase [Clostridia bacterium]
IAKFVERHAEWAERKRAEAARRKKEASLSPLTEGDILRLMRQAKEYIPPRAADLAKLIGVEYSGITVRCQRTRWGSCSSKRRLNFNCLLMLTPSEVVDSVIVHELCHLKHMDHSAEFYSDVRRAYPEYDRWNSWLKKNGAVILMRAHLKND